MEIVKERVPRCVGRARTIDYGRLTIGRVGASSSERPARQRDAGLPALRGSRPGIFVYPFARSIELNQLTSEIPIECPKNPQGIWTKSPRIPRGTLGIQSCRLSITR